jgi:hypothetical protein
MRTFQKISNQQQASYIKITCSLSVSLQLFLSMFFMYYFVLSGAPHVTFKRPRYAVAWLADLCWKQPKQSIPVLYRIPFLLLPTQKITPPVMFSRVAQQTARRSMQRSFGQVISHKACVSVKRPKLAMRPLQRGEKATKQNHTPPYTSSRHEQKCIL